MTRLAEIVDEMGDPGLRDQELEAATSKLRTMTDQQRTRLAGRMDAEIANAERAGVAVEVLKVLASVALKVVT